MPDIQNDTSQSGVKRTTTSINKKLDMLDQKMDSLYKDIYISRPDNRTNLNNMIDSLDNVLDKLQGMDTSAAGMTELLRRVDGNNSKNSEKLMGSVEELFHDQNLIGQLFANTDIHNYIAGQNYNYDLICKYLPRLQDALEILRDNVLCSDNFSKDFLNPSYNKTSKAELVKFNNNIKRLEREPYEISEFLDETYMNTSKYGEDFIYVVPYSVAFKRIFDRMGALPQASVRGTQNTLFESKTQTILKEGYINTKEFNSYITSIEPELEDKVSFEGVQLGSINLRFNTSGVLSTPMKDMAVLEDTRDMEILTSMSSLFEKANVEHNFVAEAEDKTKNTMAFVKKQQDHLSKNIHNAYDGLINLQLDRDGDNIDKDFIGAVVERIPRENILPIYVNNRCLGYYYFEFEEDPNACGFCGGHHSTPMLGNGNKYTYDQMMNQEDIAIRFIATNISRAIDTKFVNANKDLKEDIYAILRYNERFNIHRNNNINVTFLPAEDVVHCYFKLDRRTHRGVSDLERALIPAMLYILLYLTNIIGQVTRSADKRIYYVKQNVEQNVARTMMNVVQQIKKGNMGMRQIESMNNILNIVGRYNDYVIPLGVSGDPPIQFETMQGQDINTPTDLMEKMEEAAINTIMPMEMVNSTLQQDFATRYTMSNTRFLKKIYTRQRKTEKFFSKIYTKVYNYEFAENISEIEIDLPTPTYLVMQNNGQLIDNVNQMADKIIESEIPEGEDELKAEFKKLYLRDNLGNYIDFAHVEKLLSIARVNVETAKVPETEDGNPEDMMDDNL